MAGWKDDFEREYRETPLPPRAVEVALDSDKRLTEAEETVQASRKIVSDSRKLLEDSRGTRARAR